MVDKKTQLKFVDFFETKDGMVQPTCVKFKQWEQAGHKVDVIRMDNGGENIKLEKQANSKDWQLGIVFEKTARDTPQQNSLAEIRFTVVANRARAMMAEANLPRSIKYRVFREAYKMAAILDGFTVITIGNKTDTRYVHWAGKNPNFTNHLCTWGEAGTVKIKTKTTPKLEDRGVQCMFVRCALGHSGDTYRMWDPQTGGIHVSHDVIWLRQMYYKQPQQNQPKQPKIQRAIYVGQDESEKSEHSTVEAEEGAVQVQESSESSSSSESSDDDNDQAQEEADQVQEDAEQAQTKTRSGRAINQPSRFIEEIGAGTFEILFKAEQDYYTRLAEIGCVEMALVGAGCGGGFEDTHELHVMKYNQAMKGDDKTDWIKAVDEEHKKMTKYKVFKAIKKEELPKKAKILSSTWAIRRKRTEYIVQESQHVALNKLTVSTMTKTPRPHPS